jgi:hypothetical protein
VRVTMRFASSTAPRFQASARPVRAAAGSPHRRSVRRRNRHARSRARALRPTSSASSRHFQ